jgi:alginate O-acetyltransferase complex protein AlgI
MLLSPPTALWLIGASILLPLWLRLGDKSVRKDLFGVVAVVALLAPFIATRLGLNISSIGGAYFTLRLLHVTGDWWMGRIPAPSLRNHLRYQLFLPVLVSGPIHRIENFARQCARRRYDPQELLSGLERVMIGAVMTYPLVRGLSVLALRINIPGSFWQQWLLSAFDWVRLYFAFGGMTGIALGTALMMGLRLEENFNRPWTARSLLDFWMRWHMTLSNWAFDYVFCPVSAIARSPICGLIATMLVVGLWHEFSIYYVLWSFWQVLGIMITRQSLHLLPAFAGTNRLPQIGGPLVVLSWLSAAKPLINLGLGFFA